MAQSDVWKRYLETGMAVFEMTRARAETIVRDLVEAGELQRDRTQEAGEDILDRSRRSTEDLVNLVRTEVQGQLSSLGLATQDDIQRLERMIQSGGPTARTTTTTNKTPAKKTAAKKTTATKKTAAKKTPAKKTTAA